jgi:hypothetical protein
MIHLPKSLHQKDLRRQRILRNKHKKTRPSRDALIRIIIEYRNLSFVPINPSWEFIKRIIWWTRRVDFRTLGEVENVEVSS